MSEFANYVNKFQLVANKSGQEVMISFFQEQPVWDDNIQEVSSVISTEISRLFMSVSTAKALAVVLNRCIEEEENTNPNSGE